MDLNEKCIGIFVPAATLEVTDPHIEAQGNLVFIQHVTHTVMAGYRTSVRTTGGNLGGAINNQASGI